MRILMVNNRLEIVGGDGTYYSSVGEELKRRGNIVEYFGTEDPKKLHTNKYSIYAKRSVTPFQLIKNTYNKKRFSAILDRFHPDIIHLNLIYFTLTPSILEEIKKRNIPVVQTVHDGKIVCPSYQLYVRRTNKACTECKDGRFFRCVKKACFKSSVVFSFIAFLESVYNRKKGYYNLIDKFIFPSEFMHKIHVDFGIDAKKTTVIQNFTRISKIRFAEKETNEKYVIYFGRLTKIKGIDVLYKCVQMLPNVRFVIVGDGDMKDAFSGCENCLVTGFKQGDELSSLISKACCAVFPSICNENCPMALLESIALGTPVIGSRIGGIPELIDEGVTGYTFTCGDYAELASIISKLYSDEKLLQELSQNCLERSSVSDVKEYVDKLFAVYSEVLALHKI